MKVSIIVPVYNSENTISKCLLSLIKQKHDSFEIIIVNDGSKDNSLDIIKQIAKKHDNIKVFSIKNSGPAKARNFGINQASGEFVFFVDSDIITPYNWINALLSRFTDTDIACVGGKVNPYYYSTAAEKFQQTLFNIYPDDQDEVDFLPTCNLAIRKSVLDKVGYFDEDFIMASTEDLEFCQRLCKNGYKIIYYSNINVIHIHSIGFAGIKSRGMVFGFEAPLFLKKIIPNNIKKHVICIFKISKLLIKLNCFFLYFIKKANLYNYLFDCYYTVGFILGYLNYIHNFTFIKPYILNKYIWRSKPAGSIENI